MTDIRLDSQSNIVYCVHKKELSNNFLTLSQYRENQLTLLGI
jgi:hypothetical protein